MITPAVASAVSQFYALGNTPAVNLTRDLPQGVDANILLLGCGDVRNILYTAYANTGLATRSFDVTTCDIDEAIIARNIVLLSLVIDNQEDASNELLWNATFHIYLSPSDIKALCAQVEKLLNASETPSQWKESIYGALLPICDEATLDDVRHIWRKYAAAGDEASRDACISASNKTLKHSMAMRAARMGGTPEAPVQLLHYGTDPLLGFHIATAFTPLAEASPLRFDSDKEKFKSVGAAKAQFSAWVDAASALFSSKKLIVRSAVADAFAFCHTLQHLASNGSGSAGWYKRQFDDRPLRLDGNPGPPKTFNMIDTSNLADHFGTLNLLISALPLLSTDPSATLATETLLKGGTDNCSKDVFNRMLCGHGPSVALLLGVNLVEYWTNSTAESKVGEIILGAKASKDGVTQLHTRTSWKHANRLTGSLSIVQMEASHLTTMLFRIYLKMFQHEDTMSIRSAAMGGMGLNTQLPSGYTYFHRGSFVNLLKFVQGKFPTTDFGQICASLDNLIHSDRSLSFSSNNSQEFGVQLHFQALTSLPWLRTALGRFPSLGGFNAWQSIPEVAAVTLVVPRHHLDRLYGKSPASNMAAPCFIGSLVSDQGVNMFSDVQLTFGTVSKKGSPDSDDFAIILKKDPAGWSGRSPLVASFYVPTAALQVDPQTAGVALDVLTTAQNIIMFRQALGVDMRVYKAQLRDAEHVFVTKFMPGHQAYPIYCSAAATIKDQDVPKATSDSRSIFVADVDSHGEITTITGHLDILSEKGKGLLTDKVPIELRQSSPFTINVEFGDAALVLPLHFPHPVDSRSAKTRIARKSAYFEVIVPFADPLNTPALFDFVYPSILATSLGQHLPVTLNAPHLSLDSLPILDLEDKSAVGWLTTLTSFQFSAREKRLREESAATEGWQSRSPRLDFKESLFTMFMVGSGLQGGQTGLFAIDHPDRGGIHMLVFVSAFRLDAASGSVVIDAAVLPFTMELVQSGELTDFLYLIRTLEICSMTVDDAELILWKKALPALAERARTWSHKETCEYATTKKIPLSIEPNEPVLCSCGQGKLPKDFIGLPEWDTASQYATRIAISPTHAVPFVESIIDTTAMAGGVEAKDRCANCGAMEAKGGGLLKRCRACLKVMYCGAECQKKDWKKHRGECQEQI